MADDRNNQFERDINIKKDNFAQGKEENDLQIIECESAQIPAPPALHAGKNPKTFCSQIF